jgi:UDP-N-acetylmuramoyl-tripeptide--D-alanyl-D-alanine ligase
MLNISLRDFLKLNDVRFVNIPDAKFKVRHIKGISMDSRHVEQQEIFWAIKGENFDGNNFVREAHARSAFCSVISATHYEELSHLGIPLIVVPDTKVALRELATIHRLKYNIPVIAITGSNGKTTVKEMLAHILQSGNSVHKTKGNQNNQIGCPLTVLNLNESHQMAVLELGTSLFGEIEILANTVQPTHALITLIGDTHLDGLKNRDGVAKEKLKLFDSLKYGSTIFKNLDDPYLEKYDRPSIKMVSYSFKKKADYKGKYNEVDENGCGSFTINNSLTIKMQVPGLHNVRNALAAAAVALHFGYSAGQVKKYLESYDGFQQRMQIIKWNEVMLVNDAYNANPDSMELAIESVLNIKHTGKVILALGDMNELGKFSKQMHVNLLEFAAKKEVTRIFILGKKITAAAKEISAAKTKKLEVCADLKDMADKLIRFVSKGDILLLKGSRGMQMEKILAYLP